MVARRCCYRRQHHRMAVHLQTAGRYRHCSDCCCCHRQHSDRPHHYDCCCACLQTAALVRARVQPHRRLGQDRANRLDRCRATARQTPRQSRSVTCLADHVLVRCPCRSHHQKAAAHCCCRWHCRHSARLVRR